MLIKMFVLKFLFFKRVVEIYWIVSHLRDKQIITIIVVSCGITLIKIV